MSRKSVIFIGNAYEHERQQMQRQKQCVMWTRAELSLILNVYGLFVASGKWRDYGIDSAIDRAIFSIFRKSQEYPLYRIEKIPALQKRQGAFRIIGSSEQILRRGHDLAQVLRLFDRTRPYIVK